MSSFKTAIMPTRKNDLPKDAFRHMCRRADTPLARSLLETTSDSELISKLSIEPSCYLDSDSFRVDYLLVSFLSKYKGLSTGVDTKAVALTGFAAGESICQVTNARLRASKPSFVDPILYRAQNLVAKLLGAFRVDLLDGQERWGPGASSDLKRPLAYLDTKIAKLPFSVTTECLPFFRRVIKADLHWSALILGVFPDGPFSLLDNCFEITPGSRIVTVDKNAKTDRTIAIEPRGNMFLQKSVGRYIRKRLKRVGVDLDNQGLNQDLARKALDLNLATIDLSMASDTMSKQLVFSLLPIDWALYLDALRSKCYSLNGEIHHFEKFSSMGNGFTFELESLLFWAIAKASMEDDSKDFAIYGDDIIVPCSDAHVLIMALSYCGFSTNVDKTFVDGRFRESCGRHYFDGIDVTPIYQKEVVLGPCDASHIRFLNRLKRYAAKNHDGDRLDSLLNPVWKRIFDKSVRHRWHPQLPLGAEGDDGYLVAHNDLAVLPPYDRNYGYKWKVLVSRPDRIPADDRALLAYALRLGCVTEAPYGGDLISADKSAVTYSRVTRRLEPSWEFSLTS